jgi:nitrite reductase (NADH) small subunit
MKRYVVTNTMRMIERRSILVKIGRLEIALFRLSNGEFRAVENRCPHKGGQLAEGMVCDHHVFCPLHNWKIDLDDGQVQEPDQGCVVTYPVEVNELTGDIAILLKQSDELVS